MRAVWIGSVGFGLVSIPVRLYPATSPQDPRFHLVDRQSGMRVRNRRVVRAAAPPPEDVPMEAYRDEPMEAPAPRTADPVAAPVPPRDPTPAPPGSEERDVGEEHLVRGYEVEPGKMVVVEREELEALRPEPTRTIEIEHFVALQDIDPVYFERSYHVEPANEVAERPYHLLQAAMEQEERVAIGRFVMRTREHLVALRPSAGGLSLETLFFADEVRERRARGAPPGLRPRELEMARTLLTAMEEPWEPSRYRDPYRERVMELIRSREAVEAAEEAPAEAAPGPAVGDLMEALRASVEHLTWTKEQPRASRRAKR